MCGVWGVGEEGGTVTVKGQGERKLCGSPVCPIGGAVLSAVEESKTTTYFGFTRNALLGAL